MDIASFANLDFGTKPTTASLELISVMIDPKLVLSDYAVAYLHELQRRNSTRLQDVELSEEDLNDYFLGLLKLRVDMVKGVCKVWREAKQLLIPSWIEFTLSQIGEVIDTDYGFHFIPEFEYDLDLQRMFDVSSKLRVFQTDGIVLHQDAFPRDTHGDKDTMSMVVIDNYVYAMNKDAHPICSYVSAFLGMKLKEETAFKLLYRVRYDDVNFIRTMLMAGGDVF